MVECSFTKQVVVGSSPVAVIIISINFKMKYLIVSPKVPNFNPSPQITLKVVLPYQTFKPTNHLWKNAFEDYKYITTVYKIVKRHKL